MTRVFGAGSILIQEGAAWQMKRNLLNQGFRKGFMRDHVLECVRQAEARLAARLCSHVDRDHHLVRMDNEFVQLTTAVIGLTTMDCSFHYLDDDQVECEVVNDEFLRMFGDIKVEAGHMMSNPLRALTNPWAQFRFRARLRRVRAFLDAQVQARLDQQQSGRRDVLGILTDALIKEKITREELVDNLWTFVFAGAEYVARVNAHAVLCWCFVFVSLPMLPLSMSYV
jgi:cytochrome P450